MLPSLQGWFRRERTAGLDEGAAKFVSGAKLHIVVVGDADAGKTSLVRTLATEFFHTHKLSEVLGPIHIKLDTINGDEVCLEILDSESPSAERALSQHFAPSNSVAFSSASVYGLEQCEGAVSRFGANDSACTRTPKESESSAAAVGARSGDAFKGSYSALRVRLQARLPVDAVVIAFDAGNDAAFRRLATHWLPHIEELRREFGVPIPVVIAENKIDVRRQLQAAAAVATAKGLEMYAQLSHSMGGQGNHEQGSAGRGNSNKRFFRGDKLSPGLTRFSALITEFSGISACVACSSKRQLNISEVFRLAASAAMFPIAPLLAPPTSYQLHEHDRSRDFASALRSHKTDGSVHGGEEGNTGSAVAPSRTADASVSEMGLRKAAKSCENPGQQRHPRAQETTSHQNEASTVSLSHGFRVALERVFRMVDADSCDGILDRSEYHRGINCCFGQKASQIGRDFWEFPPTARVRHASVNLDTTAYFSGLLRSLTAVSTEFTATPSKRHVLNEAPGVAQHRPGKVDGNGNDEAGITLKGWFYINRLFLERNRPEVPWRVLRAYGYRAKAHFAPCHECRSIESATSNAKSDSTCDEPLDQESCTDKPRVLGHGDCHVFQMDVVLSDRVVDERELRSVVARGDAIELSDATVRFLTATFQQFSSDGHVVTKLVPQLPTSRTLPANRTHDAQDEGSGNSTGSCRCNTDNETTKSIDRCPCSLCKSSDLDNILRICPPELPLASWLASSIQDRRVAVRELSSRCTGVTLAGWVSLWQMAAALRPLQTILALRYLGVPDPRDSAIYVHFPSPQAVHAQSGLLKASTRRTLRCFVVGARGAGKTSLIERLCQDPAFDTSRPRKTDVETGPRVPISSAATDWDNAFLGTGSLEGIPSRHWLRDLEDQNATHQPRVRDKSGPRLSHDTPTPSTDPPFHPHVVVFTEVPAGCEDQMHMLNQELNCGADATHETQTVGGSAFSPPRSTADLYIFVWDKQSMESILYLKGLQSALRSHPKVPCLYVCCDFGDRTFRSERSLTKALLPSGKQHVSGVELESAVQQHGESHLLSLLEKHRQLATPDPKLGTDSPTDLGRMNHDSEEQAAAANATDSQEASDKNQYGPAHGFDGTPPHEISRLSSSGTRDEKGLGPVTDIGCDSDDDDAIAASTDPLKTNEGEVSSNGNLPESSEDSEDDPTHGSHEVHNSPSRHSEKTQDDKPRTPRAVNSVNSSPAIPASGSAVGMPSARPETADSTEKYALDGTDRRSTNEASPLSIDASEALAHEEDLALPDQASSDEFESVNEDEDDDDGEEEDYDDGVGDRNETQDAASAPTVVEDEASTPDRPSFDTIWSAAQAHCDEWCLSRPEIGSSFPAGDHDTSFYGGSVPIMVAMTTSNKVASDQPDTGCDCTEDLPKSVGPQDVFGAVVYFAHHPQLLYPRRRNGVQPSLWQRNRALRLSAYAAVATAATAACGFGLVLYLDKASAAHGRATRSSRGESQPLLLRGGGERS